MLTNCFKQRSRKKTSFDSPGIWLLTMSLMTLLWPLGQGQTTTEPPIGIQLTGANLNDFKFTDVDHLSGSTNGKVQFVGTYTESGNYRIASFELNADGITLDKQIVLKTVPEITTAITPRIHASEASYLIYWQDGADIYVAFINYGTTFYLLAQEPWLHKITLPDAYENDWQIGYTDGYAGIIGTLTNDFWFLSVQVDRDPALETCQLRQAQGGTALTTCGSCGISGNNSNKFTVSGAWDTYLQLVSINPDDCTLVANGDVQVTITGLPSGWHFAATNNIESGNKQYHAAIARTIADDTQAIIYYVENDTTTGTQTGHRALIIDPRGSIIYQKCQLETTTPSQYYFFKLSDDQALIFHLDVGADALLTYRDINPPTATSLVYGGISMTNSYPNVLLAGSVTDFTDVWSASQTVNGGIVFGLETVNSCMTMSLSTAPSPENGLTFELQTTDTKNTAAALSITSEAETIQITSMNTELSDVVFNSGSQWTKATLVCSAAPTFKTGSIQDLGRIDSIIPTSWAYDPITGFETWTIQYSIVELSDHEVDAPSWITYDTSIGGIKIDASSAPTQNTYNFQVKGRAIDSLGVDSGVYELVPFDVVVPYTSAAQSTITSKVSATIGGDIDDPAILGRVDGTVFTNFDITGDIYIDEVIEVIVQARDTDGNLMTNTDDVFLLQYKNACTVNPSTDFCDLNNGHDDLELSGSNIVMVNVSPGHYSATFQITEAMSSNKNSVQISISVELLQANGFYADYYGDNVFGSLIESRVEVRSSSMAFSSQALPWVSYAAGVSVRYRMKMVGQGLSMYLTRDAIYTIGLAAPNQQTASQTNIGTVSSGVYEDVVLEYSSTGFPPDFSFQYPTGLSSPDDQLNFDADNFLIPERVGGVVHDITLIKPSIPGKCVYVLSALATMNPLQIGMQSRSNDNGVLQDRAAGDIYTVTLSQGGAVLTTQTAVYFDAGVWQVDFDLDEVAGAIMPGNFDVETKMRNEYVTVDTAIISYAYTVFVTRPTDPTKSILYQDNEVETVAGLANTVTVQAVDTSGFNQITGGESFVLRVENDCTLNDGRFKCVETADSSQIYGLPIEQEMKDEGDGTYTTTYIVMQGGAITLSVTNHGILLKTFQNELGTGPSISSYHGQINYSTCEIIGCGVHSVTFDGGFVAPESGDYAFHLVIDDMQTTTIDGVTRSDMISAAADPNCYFTQELQKDVKTTYNALFIDIEINGFSQIYWTPPSYDDEVLVPKSAFYKAADRKQATVGLRLYNIDVLPMGIPSQCTIETPLSVMSPDELFELTIQSRDYLGLPTEGIYDTFTVQIFSVDSTGSEYFELTATHLGNGLFRVILDEQLPPGSYQVEVDLNNLYTQLSDDPRTYIEGSPFILGVTLNNAGCDVLPIFIDELILTTLVEGEARTWNLPSIQENFVRVQSVEVEADPEVADLLEFDQSKNQFSYSGANFNITNFSAESELVNVNITIVTTSFCKNYYNQTLQLTKLVPFDLEEPVEEPIPVEVEAKPNNATVIEETVTKRNLPEILGIGRNQTIEEYYEEYRGWAKKSRERAEFEFKTDVPKANIVRITSKKTVEFSFSVELFFTDEVRDLLMPPTNVTAQVNTTAQANSTQQLQKDAAETGTGNEGRILESLHDNTISEDIPQPKEESNQILEFVLIDPEEEEWSDNLLDWTVTSLTSRDMSVKMSYKDPLAVSQGYIPHQMMAFLNFSNFTDSKGVPMPDFEFLLENVPMQERSDSEAELSESIAVGALATLGFITGTGFVLNMLISASLSQLWSMINSQQVSVHAQMYGQVRFPTNALALNNALLQIASFLLVNTPEYLDPYVYDLPEDTDPFSQSYEAAGFDTNFFVNNASQFFWVYVLQLFVLLFLYLPIMVTNKRNGRCGAVRSKLEGYFFWGGTIRFFLESFFDLILSSVLNLHMANWESDYASEKFSNGLSVLVLVLCSLVLLTCAIYYFAWNFSAFMYEDFNERHGAVLDGTRNESEERRIVAFEWMGWYLMRRVAFVFSVIYWDNFLWGQMALQIMISVFMVIFLGYNWPLESPFATKMEIFNECSIVILTYFLMGFTQVVPEYETRYQMGWAFIGFTLGTISVHIFFLILFQTNACKLHWKRYITRKYPTQPKPNNAFSQPKLKLSDILEEESKSMNDSSSGSGSDGDDGDEGDDEDDDSDSDNEDGIDINDDKNDDLVSVKEADSADEAASSEEDSDSLSSVRSQQVFATSNEPVIHPTGFVVEYIADTDPEETLAKEKKMRDDYNANKGPTELDYDELMAKIDAYTQNPQSIQVQSNNAQVMQHLPASSAAASAAHDQKVDAKTKPESTPKPDAFKGYNQWKLEKRRLELEQENGTTISSVAAQPPRNHPKMEEEQKIPMKATNTQGKSVKLFTNFGPDIRRYNQGYQ